MCCAVFRVDSSHLPHRSIPPLVKDTEILAPPAQQETHLREIPEICPIAWFGGMTRLRVKHDYFPRGRGIKVDSVLAIAIGSGG